jgi:hypothetical protein
VAVVLLAAVAVGLFLGAGLNRPALGEALQPDKGAGPRYTVVHTEGTNLLVADNAKNTLYFYTIEEEGRPGDDLILRGSLDLNEVGKPVIKPTLINPRKKPNP